jgi:phosphoglycerate kinase
MIYKLRSLNNAALNNKTVLVRANLDVDIIEGEIADNTPIKLAVETIQYLLKQNCKVVILSHIGNPKGEYSDELSLMNVRFELGRLLEKQIKFATIEHCDNSIKFMDNGEVLLLENLRFNSAETSENAKERQKFIQPISKLADFAVNDDPVSSAKSASTFELMKLLPSFAGLEFEKDYQKLSTLFQTQSPQRVLLLGNIDLNESLDELSQTSKNLDKILLGGTTALAVMKAKGDEVGESVVSEKLKSTSIKSFLAAAKKNKCEVILPQDFVLKSNGKTIKADKIKKSEVFVDLGSATIKAYSKHLQDAQTVIWIGSLGSVQSNNLHSTEALNEVITIQNSKETLKFAGGKSLLAELAALKVKAKRFSHISVADKMMINYLSQQKSDTLKVLAEK